MKQIQELDVIHDGSYSGYSLVYGWTPLPNGNGHRKVALEYFALVGNVLVGTDVQTKVTEIYEVTK